MAWLTGWDYKKSIPLSRPSGAVTNYQMKVKVYYGFGVDGTETIEGIVAGKVYCDEYCKTDFSDIRFTTNDGETVLDMWLESKVDSNYAIFWIEFNSIGEDATDFYIYCGNSGASSVSNGANTFIVFDDFERGVNGDAVGGNWTVTLGAVQISTEHAYGGTRCVKILGAATPPFATIPVTSGDNIAIRFRAWKENAAQQQIQHGDGGGSGHSLSGRVEVDEDICIYSGTAYVDSGANATPDEWQLYEFNNFVWTSALVDLWHEGVLIADGASINYHSGQFANLFQIGGASNAAGVDWYVDDLIVRNWREVEPAWGAWGAWETSSTIVEYEAAGGCVAGGQFLRSRTRSLLTSGGVIAGGLSSLIRLANFISSGGAILGGEAGYPKTMFYEASGGSIVGGTAFLNRLREFLADGGSIAGGESVLVTVGGYLIVRFIAKRGAIVGGESVPLRTSTSFPVGGALLGGSAVDFIRILNLYGQGGAIFGGKSKFSPAIIQRFPYEHLDARIRVPPEQGSFGYSKVNLGQETSVSVDFKYKKII